jgi:homocitrate synthase NifV
MFARLIDTTLREGAQAPVPYLSAEQKASIVESLAIIGVGEVELGHIVAESSFANQELAELSEVAAEVGLRRSVWCRARREDIRAAAELEPEVISFALPVSDRHLRGRLGKDRAWALDQLVELTDFARTLGVAYVSVGLEDATRTEVGFLREVCAAADWVGVDRLRVADTVGIAPPGLISSLVGEVAAVYAGEIAVHLHNDFGMATANAIAAIQAGAAWTDVSLLGLGERAGISKLEEVAGWLALQTGANYDLLAAREISEQFAEWVGRPIDAHAPVIGPDIFTAESGLHVAGIAADPTTYEPYPPEAVGAVRQLRLGRHSGRAAVAALLPDAVGDLSNLTAHVRAAAAARSAALAEHDLDAFRLSLIHISEPTRPY